MTDPAEDRPDPRQIFDQLAPYFESRAGSNFFNAHWERPAVLGVLPDVKGREVLDAGCGPGFYTDQLLAAGAAVTAIDISPAMVEQSRSRLGGRARVLEGDVGRPLAFADASFDVIVASLVVHFVEDLRPVFREFHRVLRAGGVLVFSTNHPLWNFLTFRPKNYFTTEPVSKVWNDFGAPVKMTYYRRPVGSIVAPLLAAGFRLDRFDEPRPVPEAREKFPKEYEKYSVLPIFLVIRAGKPTA